MYYVHTIIRAIIHIIFFFFFFFEAKSKEVFEHETFLHIGFNLKLQHPTTPPKLFIWE